VHTGFWWGDLREGERLEGLGIGGRIILKWVFTNKSTLGIQLDTRYQQLSGQHTDDQV